MTISTGAKKRIFLSRHASYEEAQEAKMDNQEYPIEELQVRRKHGEFILVARVPVYKSGRV